MSTGYVRHLGNPFQPVEPFPISGGAFFIYHLFVLVTYIEVWTFVIRRPNPLRRFRTNKTARFPHTAPWSNLSSCSLYSKTRSTLATSFTCIPERVTVSARLPSGDLICRSSCSTSFIGLSYLLISLTTCFTRSAMRLIVCLAPIQSLSTQLSANR